MIWLNEAKKFLGAFAAHDYENLSRLLDPEVLLLWPGKGKIIGQQAFWEFLQTQAIRTIEIQNTAYRDKYIVLETRVDDLGFIFIVIFNGYGKISNVKVYALWQ